MNDDNVNGLILLALLIGGALQALAHPIKLISLLTGGPGWDTDR